MQRESDTESDDSAPSIWGDAVGLEPNRLYAVLSYRGDLASWNWTFYVPNSDVLPIGSVGTLFYVSSEQQSHDHDAGTGGGVVWRFAVDTQDIVTSPLVVAIVCLSDVGFLGAYEDIVAQDGLLHILKSVPIPKIGSNIHPAEFSSRTWFLDVICTLHDCGVVTCDDVWLLERELRRFAFTAMDKYLQNRGAHRLFLDIENIARLLSFDDTGWTAFKSEQCT